MYCDFCNCLTCQTGCGDIVSYIGNNTITLRGTYNVLHAQCEDGKWICDVCYRYECCVDAGYDPCSGLCVESKCSHRPKIISEWTFWTYQVIE